MNTSVITRKLEQFGVWVLTLFFSVMAFAQETTPDLNVDVTTTKTTTTEEWYTNPLYWVVGALLLIILIAVVSRGNRGESTNP